ncbi:MAG: hypothetical protein H6684_06320 [Deltaproteobacteria bacterium]|nr:hypothetical protein [Deltaproteobacteria bacterium]
MSRRFLGVFFPILAGIYLLGVVLPADHDVDSDVKLAYVSLDLFSCGGDDDDDDDGEIGTQYPIVLLHGFMGWGYAGPVFSNYYKVLDHLKDHGFEVYEPAVTPIATIEERAAQIAALIDAKYPNQKVNLIAHSQGGVDARYLISSMGWGDRVASLTTISTPHDGTALADIAAGLTPGVADWIIDAVIGWFGQDWDVVDQLTHDYMEEVFNPENPDDQRVAYYSFHGDGDAVFVGLWPTYAVMDLFEGCNDGIVGCVSATYGEDLGALPTDHFGVVGHPVGFVSFDHLELYLEHAEFLRDQGF